MAKGKNGKINLTGISFRPCYEKEYEFLETQQNKSQFVCELIRKYMEENNIKMDKK